MELAAKGRQAGAVAGVDWVPAIVIGRTGRLWSAVSVPVVGHGRNVDACASLRLFVVAVVWRGHGVERCKDVVGLVDLIGEREQGSKVAMMVKCEFLQQKLEEDG